MFYYKLNVFENNVTNMRYRKQYNISKSNVIER